MSTALTANGLNVKKGERSSNLELLRILATLLIIAHHYVVNSGVLQLIGASPVSFKGGFFLLFGLFGKTIINCFVLLSAYFMCTAKISARKFFLLLFEVMFYRLAIMAVFAAAGVQSFSLKSVLLSLIPVSKVSTGFTAGFLVYYLFIPFVNTFIRNLTEKAHFTVLLLCGFLFVALGTFKRVTFNYTVWFIVLHLIAAYIRLYPKKWFSSLKITGALAACSVILFYLVTLAVYALKRGVSPYYFAYDSNSFFPVVVSVFVFMFFKNIKLKSIKAVNTVASLTFGVFLIHTSGDHMRSWLWGSLLKNAQVYPTAYAIPHAIGSVIAVFIVCALIDYLRKAFIEKPFFKAFDKVYPRIELFVNNKFNSFCSLIGIKD